MILLTGLLFGVMASLFVTAVLPGKSSRPAAAPQPAAAAAQRSLPRLQPAADLCTPTSCSAAKSPAPRAVADLCTPTRYDSMTSDRYSQGVELPPPPIIFGDYSDPVELPIRQRRPQSPAKPSPLPAPIVATDWPLPKVEEEDPVAVPVETGIAARFASLEIRTRGEPIP